MMTFKCLHTLEETMPVVLGELGKRVEALDRTYTLKRHFAAMFTAHRNRRVENDQLRKALGFFMAGTTRAISAANALLQAKTWFMQGDKAHLEHAFKQLGEGASGADKFGHRLITAMGLDLEKRQRAAFNRLVSHAHSVVTVMAAIKWWRNAKIRTAIRLLNEHAVTEVRKQRLLGGALSHHSGVLLQMVVKRVVYCDTARGDCARGVQARLPAVGMMKWSEATKQAQASVSCCVWLHDDVRHCNDAQRVT